MKAKDTFFFSSHQDTTICFKYNYTENSTVMEKDSQRL
jgi:hypothetical protein